MKEDDTDFQTAGMCKNGDSSSENQYRVTTASYLQNSLLGQLLESP